jgi:large subunit ribosomal protein L19
MNTVLMNKVENTFMKKDLPNFEVGDTISVTYKLIEDMIQGKKSKEKKEEKERTQTFTGIVLAVKGSGLRTTFTIRKISNGVGVERIFLLNSPVITEIKLVKSAVVRRAKLYYMRGRVGKAAMKMTEATEEVSETKE